MKNQVNQRNQVQKKAGTLLLQKIEILPVSPGLIGYATRNVDLATVACFCAPNR